MKNVINIVLFLSVAGLSLLSTKIAKAEDWKGTPEESVLSLGGMTGIGTIDAMSGFTIYGTFSKKIINHGFISEITDSVSAEGKLGPVILSGGSAIVYGVHLRWDFEKD